ncbi:DNA-binding protein [Actinoplanes palleronii]|uniref:PIN domain-containing protein n=1 Tax=Actinoplanes palleronii TaxID=113570 RepID=A0ABQ4B3F3_9ACTN|nr:DNA-binding protein [Actinoplanes palleronii]GIE65193.1 hypothetical protein Apa02nite_013010 [Actinoplanes palleronii]
MPGTLLLDCEGLSKFYRDDHAVTWLVRTALRQGRTVATTAMTVLEADYDRVHPARARWVLSGIDVRAITRDVAGKAADLLRANKLHGHKHAIDAAFAAIARAAPRPADVLTSDPQDLKLLCGPTIRVVRV